LPRRIQALLRRARATALTLHYSVASEEAIARAHELDAPVYVWTVDDRAVAERLVRWGADGIITNDPRVFSGLTT
jgi:glycerophosphoryl diester phosphodiesterase